eukprot:686950-Pyramimonas_sp.AAC.1
MLSWSRAREFVSTFCAIEQTVQFNMSPPPIAWHPNLHPPAPQRYRRVVFHALKRDLRREVVT